MRCAVPCYARRNDLMCRMSPHLVGIFTPSGRYLGMALIFALAFLGVAMMVQGQHDTVMALDRSVVLQLHGAAADWPVLTRLLLGWTTVHGTVGVLVATAAVCCAMALRGYRAASVTMAFGVVGVMVLNVVLKYLFERGRPHFDEPLLTLTTYSFPSGHTASCTVFYGLLALFFCSLVTTRGARLALVLGAAALIASVAFSRLYLGVHYLSDVVAAVLEGCFWILLLPSIRRSIQSSTLSS